MNKMNKKMVFLILWIYKCLNEILQSIAVPEDDPGTGGVEENAGQAGSPEK